MEKFSVLPNSSMLTQDRLQAQKSHPPNTKLKPKVYTLTTYLKST